MFSGYKLITLIFRGGFFLSALLFLIQVAGVFIPPKAYPSSGVIEGYNYSIFNKKSLFKAVFFKSNEKIDFDWVNRMNELVFGTIVHGNHTELRFANNWVLWILSKISGNRDLLFTQFPFFIIQSNSGICSQSVSVFNSIMELNNVDSRFLSLDGHVVSQVLMESKLYVFDPDYGLSYAYKSSEFKSRETKIYIISLLKNKGFNDVEINTYLKTFNKIIKIHNVGEPHEMKRYKIESISFFLSFFLPLFFVVFFHSMKRISL